MATDLSILDERSRVRSITAIADQWNLGKTWADKLICNGTPIEQARALASDIIEQRSHGDRALGLSKKEISNFSLAKALATPTHELTGLEREAHDSLIRTLPEDRQRSIKGTLIPINDINWGTRSIQSVGGGGGIFGGNLVETTLDSGNFIDILSNKTLVMQMGARTINGLVGNLDIPKQLTGLSTYWVDENEPVTESSMNFGLINMRPKTLGALTSYTRQMLLQATPEIESLLRQDLMRVMALELDRAAIAGAGGLEPLGILNQPGVIDLGSSGANGDLLSWDLLLEMETRLMENNVEGSNLGYMLTSRVAKTAKQTTQNTSNVSEWIWQNGRMNGYMAGVTEQMPRDGAKGAATNLHTMIFGHWQDCMIGMWGSLEVVTNPFSTGWRSGSVEARALLTCDIQIRRPESFVFSSELIPG
jgi:HK97 family phage major capsid protein